MQELYGNAENQPVSWKKFDAEEVTNNASSDYPPNSFNKDVPFIDNKTISYDLLLNMIGRRFHACLKKES